MIGLAVTATTFSIVAVFVPVGFMPVAGQFFKPFALTIAAVSCRSSSPSFDPMLGYWPDPQLEAHDVATPLLERWCALTHGSTVKQIDIPSQSAGRSITVCSCSGSRWRPSLVRSRSR
jgi:hypothetical protein